MSDPMTSQSLQVPASIDRLRQRALIVGLVGVVASVAGAMADPAQFFQSYLVQFIFWSGLALGCLALMMVHHLSGGAWGLMIRRILEAGARTLPLMALAFVPLALGVGHVYEWAHPDVVAKDPILQHKAVFLNTPFWVARTVGYFAIWTLMAFLLTRWSREQDTTRQGVPDRRFARVAGPGLVVYGLTVSAAAIDWMMSVDPHWFSTIYGFVMMAGQGLGALTLTVLLLSVLAKDPPMAAVVTRDRLHDLCKLMFAFIMLYAYLSFSQFLIIWSANLPEEIPWYLRRLSGGWQFLMLALVLFHFALPWAILLSSDVKKHVGRLTLVAGLMFVMRILDTLFQVAPQFHETLTIHWIDAALTLGVGGIWVTAFLWFLKGAPLLPVHDPSFKEAMANHGSH